MLPALVLDSARPFVAVVGLTAIGLLAGLVVGYFPATIALNVALGTRGLADSRWAQLVSGLVLFAVAGVVVGAVQRLALPRPQRGRWPIWVQAAMGGIAGPASMLAAGAPNVDLGAAFKLLVPLSVLVGIVYVRRQLRRTPDVLPIPAVAPPPAAAGRSAGFRKGLAAVPMYFVAVGAGHIALAVDGSARTAGLARDGQAFSGTFFLGLGFIVLALVITPITLMPDRELGALARGGIAALVVAAGVVAYTTSWGYEVLGTPGDIRCIVEQGREICPRGNGMYIADARPDVFVIVLAAVGAYALAHWASSARRA